MWIIYVECRILQKVNVNDSDILVCCDVVGMQPLPPPPTPLPPPSHPRTPKIEISKKWVLSIMPKILEILVGIQMERSILVSSNRNICDHLWRWSTFLAVTFLTNPFFALTREFGKGIKSGKSHSYWQAWFNQKRSFPYDWLVWHKSTQYFQNGSGTSSLKCITLYIKNPSSLIDTL